MARDQRLDMMKGVGIILVVLGHVISNVYAVDCYSKNLLFRICYSFHMALFFFVSAYIEGNRKNINRAVIRKKTCRLLIPHFIWGMFEWCLRGCRDNVFEILFIKPYMWFLITLYLCFAIVFVSEFTKRKEITIAAAICLLFCGYIFMKDDCQIVKNAAMFLPIYLGGYYCAKYREKLKGYLGYVRFSLLLYPLSMFFYTFKEYDKAIPAIQQALNLRGGTAFIKMLIQFYNHYVVAPLGVCFVWTIVKKIEGGRFFEKGNHVLEGLGCYTIQIYILSRYFYVQCFQSVELNSICSFVSTLLIPVMIGKLVRKNKTVSTILFGG